MPIMRAFKLRGALHAVLSLSPAQLEKGVLTHSSGNHAQALAYAAQLANTRATIVMPEGAPEMKVEKVKELGASLLRCANTQESREETAAEIEAQGAYFIHPSDNWKVISGQATATRALLGQVLGLDAIVCPVGGGGLLSGAVLASKYYGNNIPVYAGEPLGADDAFRSLQEGKILRNTEVDTIADGLRSSLGPNTFSVLQGNVEQIIRVTDLEIAQAMFDISISLKSLIEPSSAVALAAIQKEPELFRSKKIGVILTGGNVTEQSAEDIFRRFQIMGL